MRIIQSNTPAIEAGHTLRDIIEQHASTPTLLLLSGGSALEILDHVGRIDASPSLTISVLDERFSRDPLINNFTQLSTTKFYEEARRAGASSFPAFTDSAQTLVEAGAEFSRSLHDWRQNNPTGKIVATLGIGTDGHTAGLFPHSNLSRLPSSDWVVAYSVPPNVNEYTNRVSVTFAFLQNKLDSSILFTVGQNKRSIIKRLIRSSYDPDSFPASVIPTMRNVTLITDQQINP